ncbi:hypothetical protein niasHS_014239 [Heterodera schachtii]|uniref:hydroxyacylglutathione hydrolase n=1 Tax=Heterodera schachtii TaxID=97005 RepID=A0ABD2I2R3_HETSC
MRFQLPTELIAELVNAFPFDFRWSVLRNSSSVLFHFLVKRERAFLQNVDVRIRQHFSDPFFCFVVCPWPFHSAIPPSFTRFQQEMFEFVKAEGTLLESALVTHHHWDHAGGTHQLAIMSRGGFSDFLLKQPLCIISGDAERVERTEKVISDGESVQLGTNLSVTAMYTPCHTSTHVCYYVVDQRTNERAVFTGDTLFVGGCGRFFEGTAEQMHHALNQRLAALPDETMSPTNSPSPDVDQMEEGEE